MKILHVFYGHDFVGGASYSMSTLAIELNKRPDIEVLAVVPWTKRHAMKTFLEQNGVRAFEAIIARRVDAKPDGTIIGRTLWLIRRVAKAVVNLLCDLQIRLIISNNSVDAVHIGGAVIDCGAMPALRKGLYLFWHLREYCDLDWDLHIYNEKQALAEMAKADACIAVSGSVAEYYRSKQPDLRLVVAYNGILPIEEARSCVQASEAKSMENEYRIGFFGGVRATKGVFEAVEAVRLLRDAGVNVSLDIYGPEDSKDGERLTAMTDKLRLSNRVHTLGWSKLNLKTYQQYDATVVASRCEAFGRVTAESQLAGVLVVGANSGGTTELLQGGRGLLFEPEDSESLATQLFWAQENPEEVRRIVENAREYALEHYTTESYVNTIERIYRTTIQSFA